MEDYRIRIRIFIGLILVVLSILGLRLFQLQVLDASAYTGESRSNAIREVRVLPARGVMYDRNGVLMVDNEPTYTITLTPRYFDRSRIGLLAGLLGVPDSVVARKLDEARAWSAFKPSPSFREVPFDVLSRILEHRDELPGVEYEVVPKRRYLTKARAAHALGYVREIARSELERRRADGYRQGDLIGQAGLEKHYEAALRGQLGIEYKQVNVHGLVVRPYRDGREDRPPVNGFDLHLTLDHRVQALAESLFVGKRGAAVALDPKTGGVIAFVSKPDFDPDLFSRAVPRETWQYLTQSPDKPMFNRATMSGMPPGSTWKPFMALMALQEGIITENTIITCPGGYRLGGRVFRDHAGHAHGPINVRQAIQHSCNTFFFTVMMRTDVNTWSRWAKRFGFGRRIPMDIAEQDPGLIPDSSYYNRTYPRGWTAGYTINLGIGQGDMVVTPMQLARYVAAVANGGTLVTPHLVDRLEHPETGEVRRPDLPEPERIPIDPKYFEVVREGMRRVMEAGTGRGVQIPGIPSGGKTGTAQAPGGRKDHSLFIMFAPVEDPRIALAVLVENGGFGASQAAPIASLMAEQYLTGQISPQRTWLIQRLMSLQSEPLPD
ncbi:penicillin-binding protein 2 [Rhodocaloribacter litoris]|uniref:penicillin-binding protein 2 n=1 Tax=Rhodocaloribacter litoris TaxID=2558931 RepID=UPI001420903C|nr:penicillin-binding protein 2 [Rhodocaloribacter litoris]QXD16569.1 penicillin-binding protein 2 [Rhodocaloribacter litoris]GIV59547.1 MAG: penicillin-binding protein 2 [Rhodothermaceae bacterium]